MTDDDDDALKPHERRHARTKETILDAAQDLIKKKGVEGLSMRAIAKAIDYSAAGLYEYFGSKDELLAGLCTRWNTKLVAQMQRAPTNLPPRDYLLALTQAYIRNALDDPDLFNLHFTSMRAPVDQAPGDLPPEDAFGIVYQAVEAAIAAGVIRPPEGLGALEVAYGIWSLAHGMAHLQMQYLQAAPFDFGPIDARMMGAFLDGMQ